MFLVLLFFWVTICLWWLVISFGHWILLVSLLLYISHTLLSYKLLNLILSYYDFYTRFTLYLYTSYGDYYCITASSDQCKLRFISLIYLCFRIFTCFNMTWFFFHFYICMSMLYKNSSIRHYQFLPADYLFFALFVWSLWVLHIWDCCI